MSDNQSGIDIIISDGSRKRIKTWVNVIATLAALVVGAAAALKPKDPVVKNSYEELKKAIERNEKVSAQNHDDIAALRSFLEGYVSGASMGTPHTPIKKKIKLPGLPPPPTSKSPFEPLPPSTSGSTPSPPLPLLHPRPQPAKIRDYRDLE